MEKTVNSEEQELILLCKNDFRNIQAAKEIDLVDLKDNGERTNTSSAQKNELKIKFLTRSKLKVNAIKLINNLKTFNEKYPEKKDILLKELNSIGKFDPDEILGYIKNNDNNKKILFDV